MRRRFALFLLFGLCTACAMQPPVAVPAGPIAIAIAKRGWHTEIGIPASALTGPLTTLGPANVHRHYLLIGYGARAYFTGLHHTDGDAAEALLPGPAAINLSAFDDLDDGTRQIVWLHVSQADVNGMLAFVWQSMPRQGSAAPVPIVTINDADVFYAATPDYNMLYNCNNWAVDMLKAGGLPFSNSGLHYASDVQGEAKRIAAGQGN